MDYQPPITPAIEHHCPNSGRDCFPHDRVGIIEFQGVIFEFTYPTIKD